MRARERVSERASFFICQKEKRKKMKKNAVEVGKRDTRGGDTQSLSFSLFFSCWWQTFFLFVLLFQFQTMVLATEPGIWVPAVVLGHLIGIVFLLYSLEKTNGSVSRLWKRITRKSSGDAANKGATALTGGGGDGGGSVNAPPVKLMRGMSADNEPLHYERAPRWVRGCSCKVKDKRRVSCLLKRESERGREREKNNCDAKRAN